MIIIILCAKCNKEIKNPSYFVRDLGYLCGQHAREDGLRKMAEIDLEISGLKKEQESINKESTLAYQDDCNHHFSETGYSSRGADGKFKELCRCEKCGLVDYRE